MFKDQYRRNIKKINLNRFNTYIFSSFVVVLSMIYFLNWGQYIFFAQENQSLFVFSKEYFLQYLLLPGAPLEYLANFFQQFYINPFYGALILSLLLFLFSILIQNIEKKLLKGDTALFPMSLILMCSLLILQADAQYSLSLILGAILTASVFHLSVLLSEKKQHLIVFFLVPIFYFITGFFALIFVLMYSLYCLLFKAKKQRFICPFMAILTASITILIGKELLFLESLEVLISSPIKYGLGFNNNSSLLIFCTLLGLFPLLILANRLFGSIKNLRIIEYTAIIAILGISIFILSKQYNWKAARFFKLEEHIINQRWTEAIKHFEELPLNNRFGKFYYNLALCESGQLCERYFLKNKVPDIKSLILKKELDRSVINRGVYFYYAIGLINEAHHWAYESFVSDGYRPENIKLLVKTNLINGNFRIAKKYIEILKNTFFYKEWALKYENMLFQPDLVKADLELGEKQRMLPQNDYFISLKEPSKSLEYIVCDNVNIKAFEYIMTLALLKKDVLKVARGINRLKSMGYSRIPNHIEEAVYVYRNLTKGELPDLGGLRLRKDMKIRYRSYLHDYKKCKHDKEFARKSLYDKWNGTFWYYMHFNEM